MKHTKGPWETRPGKTGDIKIFMVGARASGGAIASVRVPCGMEAAAEANAALIAAAPELLASLQEALDAVKVFHGADCWEIYWNNAPEMQRARAAISKAKGGAV